MSDEIKTTSAAWSDEAFRAGLEIGIRTADTIWRRAMWSSRHSIIAPNIAIPQVDALLEQVKGREKPKHEPWP